MIYTGNHPQRGSAALLAIIGLVVMTALGATLLGMATMEAGFTGREGRDVRARAASEAAVEKAIAGIEGGVIRTFPYVETGTLLDEPVSFDLQVIQQQPPNDNQFLITGIGHCQRGQSTTVVITERSASRAFDFAYFADTYLHTDNHGHTNLAAHTPAWSNGDLIISAGHSLIGEVTCLGSMLIGKDMGSGGIAHIYGNVTAPDITVTPLGHVHARPANSEAPPPTDAAIPGDATAKAAYTKNANGSYTLINSANGVSNGGVVEGTISTARNAAPGSAGTIVSIPLPIFDYARFRKEAQANGRYFASMSAFNTYLSKHYNTVTKTYELQGTFFFDCSFNLQLNDKKKPCNGVLLNGSIITTSGFSYKGKWNQVAIDNRPAIIGKTGLDFTGSDSGPIYIKGVIYSEGQIHLHHSDPNQEIVVEGAEVCSVLHNCEYLTFDYDPAARNVIGFLGDDGNRVKVLSWMTK